MDVRQLSLLWSINERLAGHEGLDIAPLEWDWSDDLMNVALIESEEWDERERKMRDGL